VTGLIALGCVRSCGVTTTAAAVATVWPIERRVLMVEADPAGGDLAARYGLAPEPGLVSLAAAARRDSDPGLVWRHTQPLTGNSCVLVGPAGAAQARTALGLLPDLGDRLAALDADVLVDCGRLDRDSPALALWTAAALRALVVRPQLADLHHLAGWLDADPSGSRPSGLVLVGRSGYPPAEVAEALGVPVLGSLPDDPAAVENLPVGGSRTLSRSLLLRHARTLAGDLLAAVAAAPVAPGGAPSEPDQARAAADPPRRRTTAEVGS